MAVRDIVKIDEEKCDGCGQCIPSCREGAIQLVDGKARLVSDVYCDGLGECLGTCPRGAITIEQRDAAEFDEELALEHVEHSQTAQFKGCAAAGGCPGCSAETNDNPPADADAASEPQSELATWPVQLRLLPTVPGHFDGADLLLCADCVPLALAGFHKRLLRGHTAAVGCPKLDDPDAHIGKLALILASSHVGSITIARMEVPCCAGLRRIAREAIKKAGKSIPVRDVVIGVDGDILSDETLGDSD